MKITFYGTRGSVPVASANTAKYGGNTTCVQIESDCIPKDSALVVDGGSGYVPFSSTNVPRVLSGELAEVFMLMTHMHHDHTQGIFLSPLTFMKQVKMRLFGPIDSDKGARAMMTDVMKPPYFPVSFTGVASHFQFKDFDVPAINIILFHPEGGCKVMLVEEFERLNNSGSFLPFGKGHKYPLAECLVVSMYKTRHPEYTVSYRFDEKPTGKVFVFMTDHENEDGLPSSMRAHLSKVDLLVMDSQYSRAKYDKFTAGFGHGTPDYCTRIALEVNAKQLGLTHHDPSSTDAAIDAICEEAKAAAEGRDIEIFACQDYQSVEL